MPTIGFQANLPDYIAVQLLPRLQRSARNVRGFDKTFSWAPRADHVTVDGYTGRIKIYPEYAKVQGATGNLLPGFVGRVHLKAIGLPPTPGLRTDFNFGVRSSGSFDAIALITKLQVLLRQLDGVPNTPVELSHLEILEREAKAEVNKKHMIEAATKRAETWEMLGSSLLNHNFLMESSKEDEFFNVRLKSGVVLKLEVLDGGIKIRELELPGTYDIAETTKLLNAFSTKLE